MAASGQKRASCREFVTLFSPRTATSINVFLKRPLGHRRIRLALFDRTIGGTPIHNNAHRSPKSDRGSYAHGLGQAQLRPRDFQRLRMLIGVDR